MLWLVYALISYFLAALVASVDKFLLVNKWQRPFVYAVYVGLLNCFAFFLWPFDFAFLGLKTTIIALAAGVSFFLALLSLYSAVARGDISKVISIIGGLSAFLILVLAYFFLGERLPIFWLISFFVLVAGTLLLSFEKEKNVFKPDRTLLLYSLSAAIFFAFAFFFTKAVFLKTSFINGFVWTRIGTVLLAFFAFIFSRAGFHGAEKKELNISGGWPFVVFVSNKSLGGGAVLLLNYAIMLGSVTIVNALRGVEYMFIFLFSFLLSLFLPSFFKEQFSPLATVQKFIGVILISIGVALLFCT